MSLEYGGADVEMATRGGGDKSFKARSKSMLRQQKAMAGQVDKLQRNVGHIDDEMNHIEVLLKRSVRSTRHMMMLALVFLMSCFVLACVVVFTREVHSSDANMLVDSAGAHLGAAKAVTRAELTFDNLDARALEHIDEVQLSTEGGDVVGFHVTRYTRHGDVATLYGADGVHLVVTKGGGLQYASGPIGSATSRRLDGRSGTFTVSDTVEELASPRTKPNDAVAPDATNEARLHGFDCWWECTTSLLNGWSFEPSRQCWACMDRVVGQLRISATSDLLQFKLGVGYTEGWCGKRNSYPNEGVDISAHPGGWMSDGVGGYTGCETTTNFPGLNSTSHQSHSYVKAEMSLLPGLQNEGTVWRGNELGFIISNEMFWPNVSPRSVLLGATVSQHKVVRPILDRLYSKCNAACESELRVGAAAAQSKQSLAIQSDVKKWVFLELWRITFGKDTPNPIDPDDFVSTQTSFVSLSTITQLLGDGLATFIAKSTISKLQTYFDELKPIVAEKYGEELQNSDCSPTPSCVDQLTSAFLDTLLAAGGLSVPGGISTAMWVLYGDVASYGDTFPEGYRVDTADPVPFYYESLRFFAPVVGLPWWTTPPARAFDDTANQQANGVRKVLNLALANKDPNAWGANAHQFEVKSIEKYHADFVGFADFAVDPDVAGGRMNRKCPGKDLGISMGKVWFQELDQDAWCTREKPGYKEATPFTDEFTLKRGKRLNVACTPVWPWQESQCCSGHCGGYWHGWWDYRFKCK